MLLHLAVLGLRARAPAVPGDARRHRAQLPRGHRVPRRVRRSASGRGWWWPACRSPSTAAAWWRTSGPRASRNRLQSVTLLDAHRRARLRRRVRRRPPRRGQGPRQGAHPQSSAIARAAGIPRSQRPEPWDAAQRAHPQGRAPACVPAEQLDRARHLAVHRAPSEIPLPSIYYSPHAHGRASATACCSPSAARSCSSPASSRSTRSCATAPSATPAAPARCAVGGAHHRRRDRRGGRGAHHRARRHARRRHVQRVRHGRPQARGLLLMTVPRHGDARTLRIATAGSRRRRQEHAHRPTAARHQDGLRGPAAGRGRRPAAATATARPTSHCSPTACAPSASRASPSTSPTATSPHRSAASSSPTRPATRSTRATWSPAHPPADVAIVLVDARHGVVEQTRRHALIASLLGVEAIVLAVNKMDLVELGRGRVRSHRRATSPAFVDGAAARRCPSPPSPISRAARRQRRRRCPTHTPVVRRPAAAGVPRAVRRRASPTCPAPCCTCSASSARRAVRRPTSAASPASSPVATLTRRRPGHRAAEWSHQHRRRACSAGARGRCAAEPGQAIAVVELADDVDVARGDVLVVGDAQCAGGHRRTSWSTCAG